MPPAADNLLVRRALPRLAPGPLDRGDVVLGWLTKLTVVLAVIGVLGFDLVALGVGRLQAEDRAQGAVRVAVQAYASDRNAQRAYEAALASAVGDVIPPGSFTVAVDGSVTLTLEHTAPTLLVQKVEPLRDWTTSRATVTGRPAG